MTDKALPPSDQNLIWIDLEMTGLVPEQDRIIEIAVVVTDPHLTVRVEGPVFAVRQSGLHTRRPTPTYMTLSRLCIRHLPCMHASHFNERNIMQP